MCIRDSFITDRMDTLGIELEIAQNNLLSYIEQNKLIDIEAVSYTHLRAHETVLDIVCRLLLKKQKKKTHNSKLRHHNPQLYL